MAPKKSWGGVHGNCVIHPGGESSNILFKTIERSARGSPNYWFCVMIQAEGNQYLEGTRIWHLQALPKSQ